MTENYQSLSVKRKKEKKTAIVDLRPQALYGTNQFISKCIVQNVR